MNAAQVRSKARMAKKRREDELEQEEIEGGELNLVPYLDIITNIVLFLLASITTGIVLGNINGNLPEFQPPGETNSNTPPPTPPLGMVVAVTKTDIRVFSTSGLEGTIAAPKITIPAAGLGTSAVDADLKRDQAIYDQLNKTMVDIVKRDYCATDAQPCTNVRPLLGEDKDQNPICGASKDNLDACRPKDAPNIVLAADGDVNYQALIGVIDAIRTAPDGLELFPGIVFSSGLAEQ